jgi:hypothetical protein
MFQVMSWAAATRASRACSKARHARASTRALGDFVGEGGVEFGEGGVQDAGVGLGEKPGATNSTITCKDANGDVVADSGAAADPANASATGLKPGSTPARW